MPWPRRITVVLWACTAVLAVLWVLPARVIGDPRELAFSASGLAVAGGPLTAGWLIVRHRPDNWAGTWLTAAGTNVVLQMTHGTWAEALAAHPGSLPASPLLWVLTQGLWMGWFIPYAMVLVLFPDGRPQDRFARWTAVGLVAVGVGFNLFLAVAPGPLVPPLADWPRPLGVHWVGWGAAAMLPALLVALACAFFSQRRRMRRTEDPVLQAQLRWMLLGAASVPATLLVCWLGYLVSGHAGVVVVGLVAMNLGIPAAALVAMLRHDLYDVDLAVVRAGVYSTLTAGALLTYAAVSFLLGRTLGTSSTTAAVGATVVVMLALRPAHRWLGRVLGRRLDPRGTAGTDAVAALVARVQDGSGAPESLEDVLRAGLGDPGLRVGYRRPGQDASVDVARRPVPEGGTPIRLRGNEIGTIAAGEGRRAVPAAVASAAALLAEAVRLRMELSDSVVAIEETTQRVLLAGDRERQRLERDLHDGAQQRLVSLGMWLRVVQRRSRDATQPPADRDAGVEQSLDQIVDRAVGEIGTAVSELRAIAHGLRPSCLDDGLDAALESLTRTSAVPVSVRCDAGQVSEHVGLTAYFVAGEALANAVKHAGASAVRISVRRRPGQVTVRVEDDGSGGAVLRPGSGLALLQDRVRAAGGAVAVTSPPGHGTVVEAVIPCAS